MANLLYTNYKVQALKGTIFPLTDSLYCALMTSSYTPAQDTDTYWADINANESSGTGYTAGGQALTSPTITANTSLHAGVYGAANVTWANATIANARYAVIYKNTGTASTSPLMALVDFGTTQSSSGDNFTITWSTSPAGVFDLA